MAAAQAAENHGDDNTWSTINDEGYVHQFQPEPTHRIHLQQQKHQAYRYPLMEHLSNDQEDHPKLHKNSHKFCDEKGHLLFNLMESQLKMIQKFDQNFSIDWEPL